MRKFFLFILCHSEVPMITLAVVVLQVPQAQSENRFCVTEIIYYKDDFKVPNTPSSSESIAKYQCLYCDLVKKARKCAREKARTRSLPKGRKMYYFLAETAPNLAVIFHRTKRKYMFLNFY